MNLGLGLGFGRRGNIIPLDLDFLFNGISTSGATFSGGGQVVKDYLDQLIKVPSGIAAIEGAEWDSVNQVWSIPPGAATTPIRTKFGTVQEITDADWRGYLSEGARTNLAIYSEDFTQWTVVQGVVVNSPKRITYPGGLGTPTSRIEQSVSIPGGTSNKTITVSCFFSGTGKFRLKNTHGGVVDNFSSDIVATDIPTRYSFTVTNSSNAGDGSQRVGIVAASDDSAFDISLPANGGFQLEQASFPSSYIPTEATTVTRPATVLEFPTAGRIREQNCAVWGRVVPLTEVVDFGTILASDIDSGNRMGVARLSNGNLLFFKYIGGEIFSVGDSSLSYTAPFEYRCIWTDKGLALQTRELGGVWGAWSTNTDGETAAIGDALQIGSRAGATHFNGNYPFLKTKFLPTKATLVEYQAYVEDEENWS